MSEPYPTLRFRDSPSSMDSSADSNSIRSWSTWTTTFSGIGSQSGRFIYGIGNVILHGVEDVTVIQRRISDIKSRCPLSDDNPPEDVEQIYNDLLELARPNLYPKYIRKQALRVICEQLKRGETRYLIGAFSRWHSEEGIPIARKILRHLWRTVQVSGLPDVRTIIALNRHVLAQLPEEDPERSSSLSDLALSLDRHFQLAGQLADLEEAILLNREALELRPPSHSRRHYSLNNLAAALVRHFDKTGQLADVEEAILLSRQALNLRPPPHPDRHRSLHNLARGLDRHFQRTGQLADVEEAILLYREALKLQPPPHPGRQRSLNKLAMALESHFQITGQHADLQEANLLKLEALAL